MYTQIFFVTSVRGIFLPPQILASGSLKAFGAKIPLSVGLASAVDNSYFELIGTSNNVLALAVAD